MTNDADHHNGKIILDGIVKHDEWSSPPWFIERMMGGDIWSFGLLLDTGQVLCISRIISVWKGPAGVWLDVEMLDETPAWAESRLTRLRHLNFITAPTSRCQASVQASKVIAAFELADT
jgi:hypothetical protein